MQPMQFEGFNIIDPETGESLKVIRPYDSETIGIGHAGHMSYYRVSHNREWAFKVNKTCVSGWDAKGVFGVLNDDVWPARTTIRRIREIIRRVKPTRNPFSTAYLADYPELA